MEKLLIRGGRPLMGEVEINGIGKLSDSYDNV